MIPGYCEVTGGSPDDRRDLRGEYLEKLRYGGVYGLEDARSCPDRPHPPTPGPGVGAAGGRQGPVGR